MKLKLITFGSNLCTIGKLYHAGELICCTMEKPWKDNRPGKSCVPEGEYALLPTNSPKFGQTYCLEGEDQGVSLNGSTPRTHILIHKANKQSQLLGCIAPVTKFGILNGEWAGISSKAAYDKLMAILDGEPHKLVIKRN